MNFLDRIRYFLWRIAHKQVAEHILVAAGPDAWARGVSFVALPGADLKTVRRVQRSLEPFIKNTPHDIILTSEPVIINRLDDARLHDLRNLPGREVYAHYKGRITKGTVAYVDYEEKLVLLKRSFRRKNSRITVRADDLLLPWNVNDQEPSELTPYDVIPKHLSLDQPPRTPTPVTSSESYEAFRKEAE